MALAAQQQAHANWDRWSHQMPQSFPVMGSPGFMPYDPRAQSGTQMQRQVSAQYLVESSYAQSPMSTVSSPPYQSQGTFSYVPYQSPPPSTPLGSPFKTEFHEHPHARMANSTIDRRASQSMREYQPYSPVSRKGSIPSVAAKPSTIQGPITPGPSTPGSVGASPVALSPMTPSTFASGHHAVNFKTLTYNETLNPADQINFKTGIDELMKIIQKTQTKEECQQILTPVQTPREFVTDSSMLLSQSEKLEKPKKQWVCDGPNCGRAFVQKTHRDIHKRTHTGQRPYVSVQSLLPMQSR